VGLAKIHSPKKKKENKATAANKMKNAGAKILQLK